MRIVEAREERERIADLVDAEIELRDAAEGQIEIRRVARREDFARRQRKGRAASVVLRLSADRQRQNARKQTSREQKAESRAPSS